MIKRLAKIIAMGVALIMCLGIITACGDDYVYTEGDFVLEVSVDKTEVSAGDAILVTAKLENLCGRDVTMQMSHTRYKELEDMLLIGLFDEYEEHVFIVTSEAGPLKVLSIKNNEIIKREISLVVNKDDKCEVVSSVDFNVGEDYRNKVTLYSNSVKITINGNT